VISNKDIATRYILTKQRRRRRRRRNRFCTCL